jgi:uncharacterized membrane-anchored protein
MTRNALRVALACCLALAAAGICADEASPEQRKSEFQKLPWQRGPLQGKVGDKASIALPEKSAMLPQGQTARFFELTGNLPDPKSTVIVKGRWFAVLWFNEAGYIKDDEKLDPDALLKSLKDRDGPSNEERASHGLPKMYTDGWIVPPHYDARTRWLEWGLRIRADGSGDPIVNYTVRVLGRSGYESVVLVSSPDEMDQDVRELKSMLAGFDFNSGEKYAEFRPGDKVAQYGLGALIVGGAAAAAVKTGFWKVIVGALVAGWKFVLAGLAAVAAGLGKLFSRKSRQ